MNLTIVFGDTVSQVQIAEDIELENFLALCQVELSPLSGVELDRIRLTFSGTTVVPSGNNLTKQIRSLNIKNDEVILFDVMAAKISQLPSGSSSLPAAVAAATSSQNTGFDANSLISSLVQGIKVPSKKAAASKGSQELENMEKIAARNLFDLLTVDSIKLDVLRVDAPEMAFAYEQNPTYFECFLAAFRKHAKEQIRKERLVKYDPMSVEAQQAIAEMIDRDTINDMHQYAMDHMPEAFVPVHMLYIRMKINGHPIVAFVDSGAQVSILSEDCAKRCNVLRVVDRRIRATAVGVGGTQKFIGRIHACQVQIKDNIFSCPFDVMTDQKMDLLLGLNTLLRHKCSIDLVKMVLRFGDGTETEFLNEQQCDRENQDVQNDIEVTRGKGEYQTGNSN